MNLTTSYLGLTLKNPFVVGASPFCDDLGAAFELETAGAAAVVMRSLFAEQIDLEQPASAPSAAELAGADAEATSQFPAYAEYQLTPDHYLYQIAHLKRTLSIPVIASLNGCRPGGWTDYAERFESAGADAIELNLYQLVTDRESTAHRIETEMLDTVRQVVRSVRIPVAVKISPFHTAPANFILALEAAGASGVVLFNRFYQPDFDLEALKVSSTLRLSDPLELLTRLRWLAIVSPQVRGSLSATGGVHTAGDAIKAILAGAHTVQVVSTLLRHGSRYLTQLVGGLNTWLADRGYTSVAQVRGSLNHRHCPDPAAFERANYQRILQPWHA